MGIKANVLAAAAALAILAAATPSSAQDPLVLAQAGITIGPRYDLGPRYEPYSESWKTYQPPPPCEWVTMRIRTPDGKVVARKKWGCRVPARDF
jgi:hypothetical protein